MLLEEEISLGMLLFKASITPTCLASWRLLSLTSNETYDECLEKVDSFLASHCCAERIPDTSDDPAMSCIEDGKINLP